jgi:hypothetical protein
MKSDQHASEQANPFELYRPIAEWVESLYGGGDGDGGMRRYFLALDTIVRHPDFDIDKLRRTMIGGWVDCANRREDQECIEYICRASSAIRQYLEARDEIEKRDSKPKRSGPPLH